MRRPIYIHPLVKKGLIITGVEFSLVKGPQTEIKEKMTELLGAGFVDTFRSLYPEKGDSYSWWSYMFHAREKNAGWRIDYFICSERFAEKLEDSLIYPQYYGSDHCPVAIITKD